MKLIRATFDGEAIVDENKDDLQSLLFKFKSKSDETGGKFIKKIKVSGSRVDHMEKPLYISTDKKK